MVEDWYPLTQQLYVVETALEILNNGGVITGFSAATPPGSEKVQMMTVATPDYTYPPQMIDAIKTQLEQKRNDLRGALSAQGITGF